MNLYRTLDKLPYIADRRKFIGLSLKTLDLSQWLPKGVELTAELSVPSKDSGISLPFAVGHKYKEDEPYEPFRNNSVYVLGICRVQPVVTIPSLFHMRQDNVGFLVVDSEGETSYTPRNLMESLNACAA